jgi:hypothetical protein
MKVGLALLAVFAGWALTVAALLAGVAGGPITVALFIGGVAVLLLGSRYLAKHGLR